jgi:hypothetical protein
VEAQLNNALVATVRGARCLAMPDLVCDALSKDYQVTEGAVQVRCYHNEGFLLVFLDHVVADHPLHVAPPEGAGLWLIFR